MATIVNNPGSHTSTGAGWGVAVVLAIIVLLALLVAIPAFQNAGSTQVTAPESIDVTVGGAGAAGSQ